MGYAQSKALSARHVHAIVKDFPVDQQLNLKSEPCCVEDTWRGCLLGCALGDACGAPVEGNPGSHCTGMRARMRAHVPRGAARRGTVPHDAA